MNTIQDIIYSIEQGDYDKDTLLEIKADALQLLILLNKELKRGQK